MSQGWDNLEPAPIEFFHGRLMDLFHEYRKSKTSNIAIEIDGIALNNIIAKAKLETYANYPKQRLGEPIPKEGQQSPLPESKEPQGEVLSEIKKAQDALSNISEDDKKAYIQSLLHETSKLFLSVFMALNLKTHIEGMIIEENTGGEFVLSFREITEHLKWNKTFGQSTPQEGQEDLKTALEFYKSLAEMPPDDKWNVDRQMLESELREKDKRIADLEKEVAELTKEAAVWQNLVHTLREGR